MNRKPCAVPITAAGPSLCAQICSGTATKTSSTSIVPVKIAITRYRSSAPPKRVARRAGASVVILRPLGKGGEVGVVRGELWIGGVGAVGAHDVATVCHRRRHVAG